MYRLPFPRMPSGKRARQQRQAAATAVRTPPPVRSKGVGGVRTRQASPRALAIAGGVALIAVIAIVLGSPQAPVEMEMFIDVQCPVCQNYETVSLPTVVKRYIRTGKVQLHLQPWAFLGGQGSQSFSGRYGVIEEPKACTINGPGCAANWIAREGFGYLTIPTLALTAFLLLIGFLVLASTGEADVPATLPAHAER